MVSSEPSEVVRNGYDAIAARHLAWIGEIHGDPRLRFLDELQRWLPDGADVVDLGCGAVCLAPSFWSSDTPALICWSTKS